MAKKKKQFRDENSDRPVLGEDFELAEVNWEVRRVGDAPRREMVWLWQGWVPAGKVTLLDGEAGVGKSALALDLAARVSGSGVMPDGSMGRRGAALILCGADGLETVRGRLEAAGADLKRVFVGEEWHGGRPPGLPGDIAALEEKIGSLDVKLLILDPLLAFLEVNAFNDQAVARCFYRLGRMAARTGCAVMGIRHWTRCRSGRVLQRGAGGMGIIGCARAALVAGAHPADEGRGVLAVSKSNLAGKPASLGYRLASVGDGPSDGGRGAACRVAWDGESPITADQLAIRQLSADEREEAEDARSKLKGCVELVKRLLAAGAKDAGECKRACAEAGYPRRTAERAARRLGVEVERLHAEQKKPIYLWKLKVGEHGEQIEVVI